MLRKRGILLLVLLAFILINIHSINSGNCPGGCGCADSQSCYNYVTSYDYYYGLTYSCSGTVSCGTDGTCSGGQAIDYYCSDGSCYSNRYFERDSSSTYCSCLGSGLWNLGGEVSATSCCGDDGAEYKLTRSCTSWCTSSTSDDACCSVNNKCVYDSVCYTSGSCYSNDAFCNSGTWYDSDTNLVYCTSCVGTGHWSIGGEVATTTCCGDDVGENYITQGVGAPACMSCPATPNTCVSVAKKCRYEYTEVGHKEESCHDGWDNDCDGKSDCNDDDCITETETECRDKINNDCDDYTDCSDPDCEKSLDCIGCPPETDETTCYDSKDNDCNGYIDCTDSDSNCINSGVCLCKPTTEVCTVGGDEDCDGKIDCKDPDCFESCGGNCVTEICNNNLDDDCDGLKDHLDRDCPGCSMNTKLCADGSCKESCDPADPQGCVGTANGNCEEGEGCACGDCLGKRGSCDRELVCDTNGKTCKCPSGTTMCSDGKCRTKCSVCGNGILEEGEECDPAGVDDVAKFGAGGNACPAGCTGTLTCKADCTLDASSCTLCPQCDPTNANDEYCCVNPDNSKCDTECTATASPYCKNPDYTSKCTPWLGDCCEDKNDGKCDPDCINYKDPDCGILYATSCSNKKDNCCNAKNDGIPDPDCDEGIDPDCVPGSCCNNNNEGACDPDCISGVDPDCKCGNGVIDIGETCDSTNLDSKTCNDFFSGYGGLLACFNADGEHACHFDTSGCHKIPDVCTGGSCTFGKDCRCPECLSQQSSCGYGAVCDATARCACIDGTTLCIDSTCRTQQNCKDYGGGEQTCIGTGTPNNVCEPGEGCGCQDCEDKKGPCNALSVCQNGMCTGCFLKRAYWSDISTREEDCIGSGNDIKMTVEGTPGCKEKTITFKLEGSQTDLGNAIFKNSKAELVWPASTQGFYKFKANLEGGDSKNEIKSTELKVEYCVKACDADCDNYVDSNLRNTPDCIARIGSGETPSGPDEDYPKVNTEGKIILDGSVFLGDWCVECDPDGLPPGGESCAAYYDCTPGWWGNDADYSGAGGAGTAAATEARTALEWGDCGVPKVEPLPARLGSGIGNMRNRLVCPSDKTIQQCCAYPDQASCYCKIPTQMPPGMNCDLPQFRPTELKGCLAEEKFPFFTNMNILIVILILTGFYIWKTRKD